MQSAGTKPLHPHSTPTPASDTLFRRTLLYGALWDSVRDATLSPADYINLTLHNLPTETDESLAASLLAHTTTALHRYIVSDALRAALTAQLATLAIDRMQHDTNQDLRINWFHTLPALAENPYARNALKQLLAGTLTVPGVTLRQQDRWSLLTALTAYADPDAATLAAAELQRDPSGDARKYAWIAAAANPSAATKQQYFTTYLDKPVSPVSPVTSVSPSSPASPIPEDWIEGSLPAFNYWNQPTLTEPYLKPSLDALAQIKQTRKIFFLVAWLNAFIEGQQSAAAAEAVHRYAQTPNLDHDLQLKILQTVDELDRTVRIRAKFSTS